MKASIKILLIFIISQTISAQNSELNSFVPKGFKILDSEKCDINQDDFTDYIVILKNDNETKETELNRPLLIIEGKKDGALKLVAKNEQIVLCFDCGGIFGDPYAGITAKKNYFSIEHFGGSNWRWTRVITFKYDKKLKKYILHKDAGESWHVFDLKKVEYQPYNKESWDKIEFENYKVE
jgi:hypothetical protein